MTLRDFLIGFGCFTAGQIVTIIYYCLFTIDRCSRCDAEHFKKESTHAETQS